MARTFESVWREILLHAPEVPVFLARAWVQQTYNRLMEDRPWAWARTEILLETQASRTVTVGVTNGSTTVTSAAAFVAGDVGRQFRIATDLPIYTIAALVDPSTITLDQAYAGADAPAATATILDAYLRCPADFGAFLVIADPSVQRVIPFWITEEQLAIFDPHRTSTGDPARLLVSRRLGSIAGVDDGRVLYEWWPYPSAARRYPALYRARPQALADTDLLRGVLADRGDLLVTGALAECAKWPGTVDRRNPYFNLAIARAYRDEFERERVKLALRDDDQYPQDWGIFPWHEYSTWGLAFDTDLLRSSDATVADYF